MNKKSILASLLILGTMAAAAGCAGKLQSPPAQDSAPQVPADPGSEQATTDLLRARRAELVAEGKRLDGPGLYGEAYAFARDVHGLNSERERVAFAKYCADRSGLYLATYKAAYAFATDVRHRSYDPQTKVFAERVAESDTSSTFLAAYEAVYAFARDVRGLSTDESLNAAANEAASQVFAFGYVATYRRAYLFARDVRGLKKESKIHAFSKDMASKKKATRYLNAYVQAYGEAPSPQDRAPSDRSRNAWATEQADRAVPQKERR